LLMVYAPGIMLQGDWGSMAFDILIALAAIIALVSALEGYRHAPLRVWERLALLAAAALLFPPSAMLRIVALALIVLLLGIHQLRARRARINA
jgi:TRAP-type uncharacterized transport system fused permease subunit